MTHDSTGGFSAASNIQTLILCQVGVISFTLIAFIGFVLDDGHENPLAMAERHGCFSCHEESGISVGPAFDAVRQRFSEQGGSLEDVVNSIRRGSKGRWDGDQPHPPQPHVDAADAEALARWILGLEKLKP